MLFFSFFSLVFSFSPSLENLGGAFSLKNLRGGGEITPNAPRELASGNTVIQIVVILDGNSEQVAHAYRKKGFSEKAKFDM